MALHNTLLNEFDNWSTYYFWFALSSGVFCFWACFIGAVLSAINVYCQLHLSQSEFSCLNVWLNNSFMLDKSISKWPQKTILNMSIKVFLVFLFGGKVQLHNWKCCWTEFWHVCSRDHKILVILIKSLFNGTNWVGWYFTDGLQRFVLSILLMVFPFLSSFFPIPLLFLSQ